MELYQLKMPFCLYGFALGNTQQVRANNLTNLSLIITIICKEIGLQAMTIFIYAYFLDQLIRFLVFTHPKMSCFVTTKGPQPQYSHLTVIKDEKIRQYSHLRGLNRMISSIINHFRSSK